jgi:hypothetical protein
MNGPRFHGKLGRFSGHFGGIWAVFRVVRVHPEHGRIGAEKPTDETSGGWQPSAAAGEPTDFSATTVANTPQPIQESRPTDLNPKRRQEFRIDGLGVATTRMGPWKPTELSSRETKPTTLDAAACAS